MAALQARAAKLARQGLPILLQGETGVGKEYLARAIHEDSRRPGRFVAVNCAAIPESLIESELFGYLPGAYTGAAPKGRKGLIEESDGGTLFLDEIGDMPLALQSRLLRVLAESEVTPIGANAPRALRLALVSASHRDLGALVREGRFREDLYYRVNAATLTVPALRERQDLDWLIARMLARHQDESGAPVLSPAALLALKAHAWPGNIRELANVLAVAAALCEHGVIEPGDLPEALAPGGVAVSAEEAALRSTLDSCAGNVSEAARRLGLDRSTVHRQMRRYGLGPRGRR
jgi:transcriptional regulator of acetoin/glycerol metabolism